MLFKQSIIKIHDIHLIENHQTIKLIYILTHENIIYCTYLHFGCTKTKLTLVQCTHHCKPLHLLNPTSISWIWSCYVMSYSSIWLKHHLIICTNMHAWWCVHIIQPCFSTNVDVFYKCLIHSRQIKVCY